MNLDGEGEAIKNNLDAAERPIQNALGDAHQQMMDRLMLQIEQLTGDMQTMWDAGSPAPISWLMQQQRMSSVLGVIANDVNLYGAYAQLKATDLQRHLVAQGQQDATNLLGAALEPGATTLGVDLTFARPPIEAMQAMAGRASNGAPLSDLFSGFGEEAAQSAKSTLLLATSLGTNPRQIAEQLANDLGVSRDRALTIARTEGLGAYRDATLATYKENSDLVGGWMWLCTLSPRTCAECLSMDGQVFSLDEEFDSHPNCFPAGTRIATQHGSVPIEYVRVGDQVLTHRGRWRVVSQTMHRAYGDLMVRIEAGGSEVTATADHPFLAERHGRLRWIKAGKLNLTDRVVFQGKRSIIDRFTFFVQAPVIVFNLEVEHDHSYIANGFAVHNCRCTQIPLTRGWGDILSSYGLDESDFSDDAISALDDESAAEYTGRQTGTEWFNAQDAATQAQIVGKAGQEAIAAGEVELRDFVGVSHDPVWGTTRYQKSLSDALTPNLNPAAVERIKSEFGSAVDSFLADMRGGRGGVSAT